MVLFSLKLFHISEKSLWLIIFGETLSCCVVQMSLLFSLPKISLKSKYFSSHFLKFVFFPQFFSCFIFKGHCPFTLLHISLDSNSDSIEFFLTLSPTHFSFNLNNHKNCGVMKRSRVFLITSNRFVKILFSPSLFWNFLPIRFFFNFFPSYIAKGHCPFHCSTYLWNQFWINWVFLNAPTHTFLI